MKFNLFFTMSVLLLNSCSPKESKIESKQSNSIKEIEFVEDSNLLKDKYTHSRGYLPSEGYIATPELASKIAFIVLSSIYGEKEMEAQLPFTINLDDNIWVIEGFVEEGIDGGSAYIEIRKETGEILKILHSK